MISTSFIIGTGFMKCIPMTFSGRFVAAAIWVIEIEEVLVAKMQFAGASSSICLKIFNFKSRFSVAASTIRSELGTASFKSVNVVMLPSVLVFSSSVRLPLVMILSRLFVMVFSALSRLSCFTSIKLTLNPL